MTTRRQPEPLGELATSALRELGRTVWAFRLEAAGLAVLVVVYALLKRAAGAPFAVAVLILVVLVAAVAARRRPILLRPFRSARVRRGLHRALNDADGPHAPQGPPVTVRRIRQVPAGCLVSVRMRRGHTVAQLERD